MCVCENRAFIPSFFLWIRSRDLNEHNGSVRIISMISQRKLSMTCYVGLGNRADRRICWPRPFVLYIVGCLPTVPTYLSVNVMMFLIVLLKDFTSDLEYLKSGCSVR